MEKTPTDTRRGYDRLALAFKAVGGGIWDYAIEADTLHCNDRWYQIMGLSPATDPVRSVDDLKNHIFAPDVAAATEVDLYRVEALLASDDRYHTEFRIVRPDREIRWIRSVACVIRDARDHLRAVGCITDVTEYRAIEAEQRRALTALTPITGLPEHDDGRHAPRTRPTTGCAGRLTDRECECLLWVSMGKTAFETAVILRISQRTVEFHLRNATSRLNAANKIHAAAIAIRLGLL